MKNRTGELREWIARVERAYTMGVLGYEGERPEDGSSEGLDMGLADKILKACKDKGLKFAYCRWTKDIGKNAPKIREWNVAEIEIEENTTKKNTD